MDASVGYLGYYLRSGLPSYFAFEYKPSGDGDYAEAN